MLKMITNKFTVNQDGNDEAPGMNDAERMRRLSLDRVTL